jgi:hypothetical protein
VNGRLYPAKRTVVHIVQEVLWIIELFWKYWQREKSPCPAEYCILVVQFIATNLTV